MRLILLEESLEKYCLINFSLQIEKIYLLNNGCQKFDENFG